MDTKINVFFSSQSFQEEDLRDKTVVIIDVLRASSTIVTALEHGAKGVISVADMSDASKISQNLDSPHYLLCGEKDGVKIEGYDLGNSPLNYTAETVDGKTIILNTTNGTKAIQRSALAHKIMIGSFLNLEVIVEQLAEAENDIALICAGWRGSMAFEDLLCAGNIISDLANDEPEGEMKDGAKVASSLYEKFGNEVEQTIKSSDYAQRLKEVVSDEDLSYCCQRDGMQVLPVMNEGIISDFYGKKNKSGSFLGKLSRSRKLEIIGILIIAVGGLVGLSIFSYQASDYNIIRSLSSDQLLSFSDGAALRIENGLGIVGAYLSHFFVYQLFGYVSLFIPFLILVYGWFIFRDRETNQLLWPAVY